MSNFMILVAPFLVIFLSLASFFFWVLKSKEPYLEDEGEELVKENGV